MTDQSLVVEIARGFLAKLRTPNAPHASVVSPGVPSRHRCRDGAPVSRTTRRRQGRSRQPLRFGVFTVTGGTVLESWKPKEIGALGKLPSILKPLEFAKDELLVLSGLSHHGRSEGLNGHEHCALMHLTGTELAKKSDGKLVASPSVDQVAARAVGDQTFLPSLELGLSSHETRYSWRAADVSVPYEANPRLVFERMFRGRAPVVPNWKTRANIQPAQGADTSAVHNSMRSGLLWKPVDRSTRIAT